MNLSSDLGYLELEKRSRFPGLAARKDAGENEGLFIPGGGFTKKLFLKW